jgi:hypothetical protein
LAEVDLSYHLLLVRCLQVLHPQLEAVLLQEEVVEVEAVVELADLP